MHQDQPDFTFGPAVSVTPGMAQARTVIVCEHASAHIPPELNNLGLPDDLLRSHIAWDPGALGVAHALATQMGAPLVAGEISRLVYDCNRPPEAPDAVPALSEVHAIPGNTGLSDADRAARVAHVYAPFRNHLRQDIQSRRAHLELMVTVHSFTPIYRGQPRAVELGILHGADARFAQRMMDLRPDGFAHLTRLNEPYSARDGVAHTLNTQGTANGLLSVMLEIRNDLIATPAQQTQWATALAPWLQATLADLTQRVAS